MIRYFFFQSWFKFQFSLPCLLPSEQVLITNSSEIQTRIFVYTNIHKIIISLEHKHITYHYISLHYISLHYISLHYTSLHYISHFFSLETEWLKSSPFDNFNLIKSWCNSIKRWAGSHLNLNLWPEFPILWTIKTSFTLYVPVLSSIHLFKSKTSRI